ncbi:MAG: ribonuclease P protein component [Clostridia bacterium]|nr:ribonuclease P protein component [Clostridia bacterium]
MIKKENRLKKNKHFNYIYKHGENVKTKFVALAYIKAKIKPFKVGFSVSNKIGKSVVRNKVKRRMRASFNEMYTLVDRRYNYIFVAREGIENLEQLDIKAQMLDAVKKAGLLNENN